MSIYQVNVPVVLIIFNRPHCIEKVFDVVRKVKPPELFIVSDGARVNYDEEDKVNKCRKIAENVDWPCKLHKIYSETNLGCGKRISSGLNEVFSIVDKAIILEDDCVPDITFFRFCEELLERYKNDERVMSVSGRNRFGKYDFNNYSYGFAQSPGLWGWATWRRAWSKIRFDIPLWRDSYYRENIKHLIGNYRHFISKKITMDKVISKIEKGEIVSHWGPQWGLTLLLNNAVGVVPRKNLVSSIGFDEDSTHFKKGRLTNKKHKYAKVKVSSMEFPLIHPPVVMTDKLFDKRSLDLLNSRRALTKKVIKRYIFQK